MSSWGREQGGPEGVLREAPRRRRVAMLAGAAVLAAAVPLMVVMACGPFFDAPVFVPVSRPQSPPDYARGRLGVLQPSFKLRDKVVAYRYLTGAQLGAGEREAYLAPPDWGFGEASSDDAARPVNQWRAARATALRLDPKAAPAITQMRSIEVKRSGYSEYNTMLNCPDDAFVAATAALASRAKVWGAASADLAEWIKGQDAVFSNCASATAQPGAMPAALPAGASSLLRYDREYQIAAANFYAGNYDAAMTGFEAVGRNASSPWQPWGEYLAARAEVRKAAMTTPVADSGDQARFDPVLLQKAHDRLASLVKVADPRIAAAAESELGFIEVRLHPQRRLEEVAKALAGPKEDSEFAQDLADFVYLKGRGTTSDADLARWASDGNGIDPLAQWRATHSTPWLVTALAAAKEGSPALAELESAAAKVPSTSPGYVTVSYQRARLMLARKQYAAARSLTTSVLDGLKGEDMRGAKNSLQGERMQTATSFGEFLADVPRAITATDNGVDGGPQPLEPGKPASNFDWDAVTAFNRQLPLARWVEAAQSRQLPQELRRSIALVAWLRANGLGDEATIKSTAALLPPSLRAADAEFATTLLLLRHPGLTPYLEWGTQRSDEAAVLGSYRDNWWCQRWGDGPAPYVGGEGKAAVDPLPMSFLTPADRAAAESEAKRLNALPYGVVWVGRRAIDYAKAHPEDKNVPEALALTVRATRYGCYTGDEKDQATLKQKAISKEAFALLHRQYPRSQWTDRTPYYF